MQVKALLALGANQRGVWGDPGAKFARAVDELSQAGVRLEPACWAAAGTTNIQAHPMTVAIRNGWWVVCADGDNF